MPGSSNNYDKMQEILSGKQLSQDIAVGNQRLNNKFINFNTNKTNINSKKVCLANLEKNLSDFTPDYMADGRNQPEIQKRDTND